MSVPSGLILLNKKPGVTSFDALGEIKRALGTGKVGHTGTLDKFAQGLLVVLTGRALRLSKWFSDCDKQYLGKICFGMETDTLDPEGSVIAKAEVPARKQVEQVLGQFTGNILQAPPAYSAIHIDGKRASELARAGKAPEMKKRPVTVYSLELQSWTPPFAEIFVHCSSGTYIRSLAKDIALAAGSRAHLVELARIRVSGFGLVSGDQGAENIEENLTFGRAQSPVTGPWTLIPVNKAVIKTLGIPWFELEVSDAEKIIHGKPLAPILDGKLLEGAAPVAALDYSAAVFVGETLLGIVEKTGHEWKYGCVLSS